jgi:O-antigen ligase
LQAARDTQAIIGAPSDAPFVAGAPLVSGRGLLFFAILALTLITLQPFGDLGDPRLLEVSEGNDALAYVLFLGMAAMGCYLVWATDRPALKSLLAPSYGALAAWIGVTCVLSQDPVSSMKRATMLVFVVACSASLFLLPRDKEEMGRLLSAIALLIIGLSYFGVIFLPQYSIHQVTDLSEPQLAGNWRGVFGHKNLTSAVFSVLSFIGFFVRSQRPTLGSVIIVLSLVFVFFSGGKSSSVICVATILVSAISMRISSFTLWALLMAAPLAGLNLFGIGSVAIPSLAAITSALPLDSSFTGRSDVWVYALSKAAEKPLFGYGYLAFWNTEAMLYGGGEQSTDWAQTASHAHNGYLDAVLSMGYPGLMMFFVALMAQPALDIRRAHRRGEEPELTLMFQRIWMFSLYLSSFETFVFNRAQPSWVLLLFSVFSVRYLANFRVRSSQPQQQGDRLTDKFPNPRPEEPPQAASRRTVAERNQGILAAAVLRDARFAGSSGRGSGISSFTRLPWPPPTPAARSRDRGG